MMKKILFTCSAAFLFSIAAKSQALNGGFENWSSQTGEPQQPTGWTTANVFASPFISPSNPTSAFQATTGGDLYMDTKSLRLQSVKLQVNPDTANIPDTLGPCVTGTVQLFPTFLIRDRIPFTGRPNQMNFAAKYAPNGIDTASIYIELSKWNGTSRDIVMALWAPINTASSYVNYSLPLSSSYLMSIMPDSLSVAITSTSPYVPRVGSVLHIDNVSFSGWVGIDELSQDHVISTYPNPATEMITIDATKLTADLDRLEIFNAEGKRVAVYSMRNATALTLNVSAFPAGNYTYSLVSVLDMGLADGKFQIVK